MKYLSILLLLLFTSAVFAGSTQTNTSGSNTAIEGGYTSTATTTYQSGSESTTTTNNTTNSGIQTFGIGVSGGKHVIDKNCERLKLARILNDFGMKVAAVAILCQDERVFESMIQAGTPCPIDGKIGKEAKALWSKYDHERPDYDIYIKRMREREKKEKEIALIEKKKLEEEIKMTEELEKIDKDLEKEKLKNLKNVR